MYVNGQSLEPEVACHLVHGDRIIFGPCRLITLYLEHSDPLLIAKWTYGSAFQELTIRATVRAHTVRADERLVARVQGQELAPARQRLLEQLHRARVGVEQANQIR